MKTTYTIIRVGDAPLEHGEIDWPDEPGLKLLRALIEPVLGEGEPLEHVSVLHEDQRRDMFVSELGHMRLTWREPLPINVRATAIYRNNWLTLHPAVVPETLPAIAGTAILFDRWVWFRP